MCGRNVTAFFDPYVRGAAHIDFNRYLQTFQIEVLHDGTVKQAAVTIGSREFPVVKVRDLPNATDRRRAIFAAWSQGE